MAAQGVLFHRFFARAPASSLLPLLLIHGMDSTSSTWAGCFDSFADHRDVLAVDLHGHGRTPLARESINLENCADDIAAVLRANDLPRVHVLGHSLGARMAVGFALRYPEAVASLVLEDMDMKARTPRGPAPDIRALQASFRARHASLDEAVAELVRHGYDEARARGFASIDRIFASPEQDAFIIGVSPVSAAIVMRDVLTHDHLAEFASVAASVPIMLAYSADPYAATSPDTLAAMRSVCPADRPPFEVPFTAAGHSVHRTRSAELAAAVRAWLLTLEPAP